MNNWACAWLGKFDSMNNSYALLKKWQEHELICRVPDDECYAFKKELNNVLPVLEVSLEAEVDEWELRIEMEELLVNAEYGLYSLFGSASIGPTYFHPYSFWERVKRRGRKLQSWGVTRFLRGVSGVEVAATTQSPSLLSLKSNHGADALLSIVGGFNCP